MTNSRPKEIQLTVVVFLSWGIESRRSILLASSRAWGTCVIFMLLSLLSSASEKKNYEEKRKRAAAFLFNSLSTDCLMKKKVKCDLFEGSIVVCEHRLGQRVVPTAWVSEQDSWHRMGVLVSSTSWTKGLHLLLFYLLKKEVARTIQKCICAYGIQCLFLSVQRATKLVFFKTDFRKLNDEMEFVCK